MSEMFLARVMDVEARVEGLETQEVQRAVVAEDNVSNPPTDAQLDTAFGTPAAVGEGFLGLVDDNDAGWNVWLVASVGGKWWYEALTAAV